MSRRTLAHDSGPKNPAVNYLEFKSDGHKKPVFAYFDKEKYEGYTEDEIKQFRKQYDDSEIDELPWNVKQELPWNFTHFGKDNSFEGCEAHRIGSRKIIISSLNL